jgi:hypothetical protein
MIIYLKLLLYCFFLQCWSRVCWYAIKHTATFADHRLWSHYTPDGPIQITVYNLWLTVTRKKYSLSMKAIPHDSADGFSWSISLSCDSFGCSFRERGMVLQMPYDWLQHRHFSHKKRTCVNPKKIVSLKWKKQFFGLWKKAANVIS